MNDNSPVVRLTDKCDVICRKCPDNINGMCLNEEKVSAIDRRCLDELSLDFGDDISWNDLKKLAFENIINCQKLKEVCRDCQCNYLCK